MISYTNTKPWYSSRTFWFNILSGLMIIAAMPEVSALLPEFWLKWLALFNAVGNLFMRSITAGGVSLK